MAGFDAPQQPAGYSETYTERERGTLSPGKHQDKPYTPSTAPSAPPAPAYNQTGFHVDFATTPYTLPRPYSTVTTNQAMPSRISAPEATGVSRSMSGESLKAYEARARKIAEEICQCKTAIVRLFINEDDETLRELVDLIRKSEDGEKGADLPEAAEKIKTGVSKENRDEGKVAFVLKSTPNLLAETKKGAVREALRDFPNDIVGNTRTIISALVEAILSRKSELEAISSQAAALRKYVERKAAQAAQLKPGFTEGTLALADCLKRHAELKEMISLYDFPAGENRNTIFKEFAELTEKIDELKQIILLNDGGTSTRTLKPRQIAGIERHKLTKQQGRLARMRKSDPFDLQPTSEEEYDEECGKSRDEIKRIRRRRVDVEDKTLHTDLRRHSSEYGQSPKAHERAVSKSKRERAYAREDKACWGNADAANLEMSKTRKINSLLEELKGEERKILADILDYQRTLKARGSDVHSLEAKDANIMGAIEECERKLADISRRRSEILGRINSSDHLINDHEQNGGDLTDQQLNAYFKRNKLEKRIQALKDEIKTLKATNKDLEKEKEKLSPALQEKKLALSNFHGLTWYNRRNINKDQIDRDLLDAYEPYQSVTSTISQNSRSIFMLEIRVDRLQQELLQSQLNTPVTHSAKAVLLLNPIKRSSFRHKASRTKPC